MYAFLFSWSYLVLFSNVQRQNHIKTNSCAAGEGKHSESFPLHCVWTHRQCSGPKRPHRSGTKR